MRGLLIFVIVLLLSFSFVAAVTGPFTYNGKNYYTVTSTDPTEDTGNEVCTKVGKTCVGYTDTSTNVCLKAHAGAAVTTSASGDSSGVYCDGAPQTGVCASESNSCHTCPTCTVSVACNQEIGGLYREMYVECGSGQCKIQVQASTVQDLLNQIPSINSQLQGCPQSIPSFAKAVAKNGVTRIDISMNNGQTQSLAITVKNGQIASVTSGAPAKCSQKVTASESDLNTALQSTSPSQAYAYLYGQGKIKVTGCTFFKTIGFWFANLFGKPVAKKAAPSMPPQKPAPNCGQVGEQCNNRACFSGICGAPKENLNGQWGYWNYRCLDQNEYDSYCVGQGNTPPTYACLTGPCR